MAKKVRKASKIKVKKKTWHKVFAPKAFGSKEIGESYLQSVDKAVGRKLRVNLRNLTNSIRDQNIYLGFQITSIDGTSLRTSTISFSLTPTFVKRLVRKNSTKLDGFFVAKTKDGQEVALKTLMFTFGKVQRSTSAQLRKEWQSMLEKELAENTFDSFVSKLCAYRIQAPSKKKLSKIFPVKEAAVRVATLRSKPAAAVASEEKSAPALKEDKPKADEPKPESKAEVESQEE